MTQPQNKEPSDDEQLLDRALRMDHEMARGIAFESISTGRERTDEELAFAHIYNCLETKCGEFWQEITTNYPGEESQIKLLRHKHLAKIMEAGKDKLFPTLNPFWEQRN